MMVQGSGMSGQFYLWRKLRDTLSRGREVEASRQELKSLSIDTGRPHKPRLSTQTIVGIKIPDCIVVPKMFNGGYVWKDNEAREKDVLGNCQVAV